MLLDMESLQRGLKPEDVSNGSQEMPLAAHESGACPAINVHQDEQNVAQAFKDSKEEETPLTSKKVPIVIPDTEVLARAEFGPAEPLVPDVEDDLDPQPVEVDPKLFEQMNKTASLLRKQTRRQKMISAVEKALEKFKLSAQIVAHETKKLAPYVAAVGVTAGSAALGGIAFGSYGAVAATAISSIATLNYIPKVVEKEALPEFIKDVCDAVSRVLNVALDYRILKLAVTVLLIGYVSFSGRFNLIEKLAACAFGAWISKDLILDIFNQLVVVAQGLRLATSIKSGVTKVFPQGFEEKNHTALSGVYSSVTKLCCSLFGLPGADRITKEENEDVSRLRNQFGLVKDAHSFMHWLTGLLHSAFNRVHIHFFGFPSRNPDNEQLIDLTNQYCEAVEAFATARLQSQLINDVGVFDQMKALIKQGDDIYTSIVKNKLSVSQFPRLRTCHQTLKDADALVQSFSRYDYGRPEPVYIHIDGPPQTGKSTLAQFLFADISEYKFHQEYKAMKVYSKRFSKEEFWEGYCNQPFVLFEEIWQNKDEELRAEIGIFLCHLINVHIMPLDMAFSGKGRTFFDSRLIISTSNGDEKLMPSFNGMQDKEAYFRRIDFWIRVKDKKMENASSLTGQYRMDLIKTSRQGDVLVHEVAEKDISYIELLQKVLNRWDLKEKSVAKNVIHSLARQTLGEKISRIYNLPPDVGIAVDYELTRGKEAVLSKKVLAFARLIKEGTLLTHDQSKEFVKDLFEQVKELKDKGFWEPLLVKPTIPLESVNDLPKPGLMDKMFDSITVGVDVMNAKALAKLTKVYHTIQMKLKEYWIKITSSPLISLTRVAIISGIATAIGSLYFLWKHYRRVKSVIEDALPQSFDAAQPFASTRVNVAPKKFDATAFKPTVRNVHPQGTQINPDIIQMIEKNLCTLGTTRTATLCNGLFLKGKILVTTAHSFEHVLKGEYKTPLHIFNHKLIKKDLWIDMTDLEFVTVDDLDLLFIRFNHKDVPEFADITHHIAETVDRENYNQGVALCTVKTGSIVTLTATRADQIGEYTYGSTHIPTGYSSKMATFNGDCGGPWLSLDTRDIKKIFGIHVAGNGAVALCTVLVKSVVDEALKSFVNKPSSAAPQGIEDTHCFTLREFLNVYGDPYEQIEESNREIYDYIKDKRKIVGILRPEMKVNLPTKTMLLRSPVAEDVYPLVMAPAVLRPNRKTGYSPLFESLKKALKVKGDLSPETESIFRQFVKRIVDEYRDPNVKYRTLSLEECLNPQKICPNLGQINLKTSKGYPFNIIDRGSGKKEYISETDILDMKGNPIGKYQSLKPDFAAYYEDSWRMLGEDEPPVIVFQASLKDELRPVEKVEKPRMIFPEPCDFQIHQRRLYGMFIDQVIAKCNENTIKLGINPLGLDWTRLYNYLHVDREGDSTDRLLQGDISANDWSQYLKTMIIVYEAIDALFDDEPRRRYNASEAVYNAKVIILNFIVEAIINPSGQLLTTIENSINIPASVMTSVFFILREKGYNYSVDDIYRMLKAAAFGDDTAIAYSYKKCPVVFSEVAEMMLRRFGLVYTDPRKDGSVNDTTSINDLHFLCRSLRKDGVLWKAPLREQSIIAQVNWYSNSNKFMGWEEHYLIALNNALREWYQYGRDKFEEERKRILGAKSVRELFHEHEIKDYDYFNDQWHEVNGVPPPPMMEVPESDLPYDLVDLLPQGNDDPPVQPGATHVAQPVGRETGQELLDNREANIVAVYFTDGILRPEDSHMDIGMYESAFAIEVNCFILSSEVPGVDALVAYPMLIIRYLVDPDVDVSPTLLQRYIVAITQEFNQPILFMREKDAKKVPLKYLFSNIGVLADSEGVHGVALDFPISDIPPDQPETIAHFRDKKWTIAQIRELIARNEALIVSMRTALAANPDAEIVDLRTQPPLRPQGVDEVYELDRSFKAERIRPKRVLCANRNCFSHLYRDESEDREFIRDMTERNRETQRWINMMQQNLPWYERVLRPHFGLPVTNPVKLPLWVFFMICFCVSFVVTTLYQLIFVRPLEPQGIEDLKSEEVSAKNDDVTALTGFTDQASKDINIVRTKSSLYSKEDPYPDQEMKAVLSRAYTVNYTWTSSIVQGASFAQFDFPNDIIVLSDNIAEKLNKFVYFRAAVKIQFRVNGTPFHYGKLAAVWMPNYDQGSPYAYEMSTLFRGCMNNVTILSANTSNVVEIVIPYVAPAKYMLLEELSTYPWYFGALNVFVLHPLLSSSSATVPPISVAITVSFVDPEVAGLTSSSFGIAKMPKMKHPKKDSNVNEKKLLPQGNEQVEATNKGYLSGTLAAVSKISAMMTTLPIIGGVASVVSPISGTLASIAKTFGYDKPTDLKPPLPKLNVFQPTLCKGSGVDTSDIISIDPANAVSAESGYFCDDKDYTQIINYARLPGLISVNTFTSLTDGQILQYIPVAPGFANYVTTTGPIYTYDTTPLMAVANLFRYWTGGLKYAIKISTSSFISWRLRITYIPNHNYSVVPDPGNGDYISRTVDINGDTTITFCVPYLGITEFMRYVPAHVLTDPTLGPQYVPLTSGGMLILSVANAPTYTASTVSPVIYSSIWVAAAEDFRVACPVEASDNLTTVSLGPFKDEFLTPQGLSEDSEVPRRLFSHTFDPLAGKVTAIIRSGLVHGEEIASLLTLGHRYTINITWNSVSLPNGTLVQLKPTDNVTSLRAVLDTKTYLRQLFLFSRGSTRYKFWCDSAGTKYQVSIRDYSNILFDGDPLDGSIYSNSGVHLTNGILFSMAEFQVPFYSQLALVNNKFFIAREFGQMQTARCFIQNTATSIYTFYEAFGDDYSLGWPKTPLPLVYTYTADSKEEEQTLGVKSIIKPKVAISLLK